MLLFLQSNYFKHCQTDVEGSLACFLRSLTYYRYFTDASMQVLGPNHDLEEFYTNPAVIGVSALT